MAQSLNARIRAWAKSGRKFAETGLDLIVDAIGAALDHGNLDPAKRIIAALDRRDAADALMIFGTFLPVTVKNGDVTLQRNWKHKAEALPSIEREKGAHKSFRTLAEALRPTKDKTEVEFDLAAYIKGFDRLNKKAAEGAVPAEFLKRMKALAAEMHRLMESTEGNVVSHPSALSA